jgi:hypothetical protein
MMPGWTDANVLCEPTKSTPDTRNRKDFEPAGVQIIDPFQGPPHAITRTGRP